MSSAKPLLWLAKLNLAQGLSIIFCRQMPYTMQERCIKTNLEAAKQYNFKLKNIMFELY